MDTLALTRVEAWLDSKHGPYKRLTLSTPSLDSRLAGAFEDGEIKARGYLQGSELRLVAVVLGARVAVKSLVGTVTVMTPRPARGPMGAWSENQTYRDVLLDLDKLQAWCATMLGEPPDKTSQRLISTVQSAVHPRSKWKLDPIREVIWGIYGDAWPRRPIDKATIGRIQRELDARNQRGSASSIRRAIDEGPPTRTNDAIGVAGFPDFQGQM